MWLAERNIRVRAPKRKRADAELARGLAARVESAEITAPDGTRLSAWLLHPAAWRGEAAIVLHGFVDTRTAMLDHARFLLRHGYAVLLPDSRGHGESGGEAVSFGVREHADVGAWADWLCGRLGIRRFIGLGQSMGAAVLLHALPGEPRLERVIAESAFTTFRDAAYDRLSGRAGIPRWLGRVLFRPAGELAFLYVRWRYGFNLNEARPVDALRRAAQPVLLIHGSDDEAIRASHSRQLHEVSGAEYWEIAGAAHTDPLRVAGEEYERRVIAWLSTSQPAGSRA